MAVVYLALYKGRKSGTGIKAWTARLVDWAIRQATGGIYAHCEIAVLEAVKQYPPHIVQMDGSPAPTMYTCYSASARDGGVRQKVMPLPSEKWDLIPVGAGAAVHAADLYRQTAGCRYDWRGAFGTVLPRIGHSRRRWFCSEWCAAALGFCTPGRFSPNYLAKLLGKERQTLNKQY